MCQYFEICNFQTRCSEWYLWYFLRNCAQLNANGALLMISQHRFRQWLDAVRQQAINWANVGSDLCHHKASLCHNKVSNYNLEERIPSVLYLIYVCYLSLWWGCWGCYACYTVQFCSTVRLKIFMCWLLSCESFITINRHIINWTLFAIMCLTGLWRMCKWTG